MSVLVLIVAGTGLGAWALRPFGLARGPEGNLYRFLAGVSLCAVFLLAAGSVSLRAAQFAMLAYAAGWLGWEIFAYARRRAPEPYAPVAHPPAPPRLEPFEWVCAATVASALGLALISALAPAAGTEAAISHLALARDYAREGRLQAFEGNPYSAYPALAQCLFAFSYYQGGEVAAQLVSWCFGAVACWATFAAGRRLGGREKGRRIGLIAAAILASAPVFHSQAGNASIDVAFTAFVMAALAAFLDWRETPRPSLMAVAGMLAGFSCGIRHTGYLVCALLTVWAVFAVRVDRFRYAGLFGAAALACAAPWLLRSWWLTGNPVYPFLAEWLGQGGIPHGVAPALAHGGAARELGLAEVLLFPWRAVMRPDIYGGWATSPGGLVLILGVPGLFAGGRDARALGAFSGVGALTLFLLGETARQLLPFFVPLMAVAALAEFRLKSLGVLIRVTLVTLFVYGLVLDAVAAASKVPAVIGLETRDAYLGRRVARYAVFEWLNSAATPDETVLTLDPRAYYFKGRTFMNDESLRRMAVRPLDDQVRWMQDHDIRWVLVPATRIEESLDYPPVFRAMAAAWRTHPRHFAPIRVFDLARTQTGGTERVEVYRMRYNETPRAAPPP